jgi:hypothetical protein
VQNPGPGRTLTAPATQGAVISTFGWIIVVAAAWLAVATVVGVLVGRMIRERDRQVPPAPEPPPSAGAGETGPTHRVHGQGHQRRS